MTENPDAARLAALKALVTHTDPDRRTVMLRHGRYLYGIRLGEDGKPVAPTPTQRHMVLAQLSRYGKVTGHDTVDGFLADLAAILEGRA